MNSAVARRRVNAKHHTPKHATWLNMAESEISDLTMHCLDRRLLLLEDVQGHSATWSRDRNGRKATIQWTFNHADARRVFPELYRHRFSG
jgi:hypothetical protein